jgi:hypothetical protein
MEEKCSQRSYLESGDHGFTELLHGNEYQLHIPVALPSITGPQYSLEKRLDELQNRSRHGGEEINLILKMEATCPTEMSVNFQRLNRLHGVIFQRIGLSITTAARA